MTSANPNPKLSILTYLCQTSAVYFYTESTVQSSQLTVSLTKWIISCASFTENRYFKQYNQKLQFWHLFVWQGHRKLLSCHFKHHPQFCVGSWRAGVLEGLFEIYSRETFHFLWFCFKGTPPKCAALPEFMRKHTLESICVFGRVRFIWCQAILTRRSELKELTLPTEGPALWRTGYSTKADYTGHLHPIDPNSLGHQTAHN